MVKGRIWALFLFFFCKVDQGGSRVSLRHTRHWDSLKPLLSNPAWMPGRIADCVRECVGYVCVVVASGLMKCLPCQIMKDVSHAYENIN